MLRVVIDWLASTPPGRSPGSDNGAARMPTAGTTRSRGGGEWLFHRTRVDLDSLFPGPERAARSHAVWRVSLPKPWPRCRSCRSGNRCVHAREPGVYRPLAQRLGRFRSTAIPLEFDRARESQIRNQRDEYLAGQPHLRANEIYQIGFGVAKSCGVRKIYGFDESEVASPRIAAFPQSRRTKRIRDVRAQCT
jgi:hypothetical protein